MTSLLRLLVRLLFRIRAFNEDALRTPGPVLLIPNHTSWFDWLFLGVCLGPDWKFVTSSTTAKRSWLHKFVMVNSRTFPIDNASPYAVKHMAEFLQSGGKLVLFAEGRISRTGTLMKLFDGTGFLIHKTHAKVITAYLRGASRLPFSPQPGWKRWFPTVTTHFSDVLIAPHSEHLSTAQSRALFTRWLRDQMVGQQFRTEMAFGPATLPAAIAEAAAAMPSKVILEDATLSALTYRKLLIGARLLGGRIAAVVKPTPGQPPPGPAGPRPIGVLLPNVNATPIVLLALWQQGKIPAVLNYSTGTATMLACVELAGLKHIVTSRTFLARAKLDAAPFEQAGVQLLYLEDLRKRITPWAKLTATLRTFFPAQLSTLNSQPSDTAVILFTSGSEGVPKGVELSHRNILANIRQMLAVTDLTDQDRLFNCLPLFHSFGLTVGLLVPLVRGMFCFIYPSPLHYRVIPSVLYDRDCTVLLSTNTFLNGYGRKAHAYDFRSMRYLFAAAEKLQAATAQTWSHRFGVRVLEGYGATECAPCLSVNTPLEPNHGTVGRFMPGVEWRVEPVEGIGGEAGEKVGKRESESAPVAPAHSPTFPPAHPLTCGRLFVRGPNIMKGYLNADANAKFQALGGWYDTGDIVSVDAEGFITIRGRLKRFAKISGEMVSLTAVEDALAGAFPHYGLRCATAVVTRPDEDKGEALICCTNEPRLTAAEIREAIKAKGLSNLCIPREIVVVKEIPKLGTGKTNHRELQALVIAGK